MNTDNESNAGAGARRNRIEIPKLELPKGGGAIRAIDEKFRVNAANGTSALSIPLPFQAGRGALVPGHSLNYDSGSGAGVFGAGWTLDLPSVTRATGKRLPGYDDAADGDDFQLSGVEDLVPAMRSGLGGEPEPDIDEIDGYRIQRYRPRSEGTFWRIERISLAGEPACYWRISPGDGTTTIFGRSGAARIADPQAPQRVFRWLPEWRFDDQGNCLEYVYKAEDLANVPRRACEANRHAGATTFANRYLKRIFHNNRHPYSTGEAPPWDPPRPLDPGYFFQAVFDYGEHGEERGSAELRDWMARGDPLSDRRAGFELRTYRLCRRILFLNRFEELDPGAAITPWIPVKGLELSYAHADFSLPAGAPIECDTLLALAEAGYRPDGAGGVARTALAPTTFAYHPAEPARSVSRASRADLPNAPEGLMGEVHALDLYGDGVPGLLSEVENAWLYARNLGQGRFGPARQVWSRPSLSGIDSAVLQVRDLDADGAKEIVVESPGLNGYFPIGDDGKVRPLVHFMRAAVLAPQARRKLIDLDGDGRPEIVVAAHNELRYLDSLGRQGHGRWRSAPLPAGPERLPFGDESEGIHVADMSGDGLADVVRVRHDSVAYWPNLGHGRFGARIDMDGAPLLDSPERFDARRVQLADLSGTGASDLVYESDAGPLVAINQGGNGWAQPVRFPNLRGAAPATRLIVMDLLAEGTPCLVRSSSLAADAGTPLAWIDLYRGAKPYLLAAVDNGAGKTVNIGYRSSAQYLLDDERAGQPWLTRLPFPVACVARVEIRDSVTNSRFVTTYRYRHGYYDQRDREFRGFAMVEETDTESYASLAGAEAGNAPAPDLHEAPTRQRQWFHTGAFPGWDLYRRLAGEFAPLPAAAAGLDGSVDEDLAPDAPRDRLAAHRVLKGKPLRTEVCVLDGTAQQELPYQITIHSYRIGLLQAQGGQRYGVYQALDSGSSEIHMERDAADPRITSQLSLAVDDRGLPLRSAQVAYGRAAPPAGLDTEVAAAQRRSHITVQTRRYTADIDTPGQWRSRALFESAAYELTGLGAPVAPWSAGELDAAFLGAAVRSYGAPEPATPARRLTELDRTLFAADADPDTALALGVAAARGIVHERYRLAFDSTLPALLYGSHVGAADLAAAGYRAEAALAAAGLFPLEEAGRWWSASGRVEYPPDPQAAFFRPHAYIDPMGQRTEVREYRDYYLLIDRIRDAAGNHVTVTDIDFYVVAPREVRDINDNLSGVAYDRLGLVSGSALMGKGAEADTLAGFAPDLSEAQIDAFFADPPGQARALLGNATTRVVSDHRRQPNWSAVIGRAMHAADESAAGVQGQLQVAFDYTDGMGRVALRKLMAEPGEALTMSATPDGPVAVTVDSGSAPRWVASGRKVANNKGNVVLEYSPYFALTHVYEDADALVAAGHSRRNHHDGLGRLVAVDHPDGSREETRIAAWSRTRHDRNDLAPSSAWRSARIGGARGPAARDAALQTDLHAATPTVEHSDALGHLLARIDHNRRIDRASGLAVDEFLVTRSETDIEGNVRRVRDPRGVEIVRHAYDMSGTRAASVSADSGARWRLSDALGKMALAGDAKDNRMWIVYDAMQRPWQFWVRTPGGPAVLREHHRYGGAADAPLNANGRLVELHDSAGSVATPRYDLRGNVLETARRVLADPRAIPDWQAGHAPALAAAAHVTLTRHDALNRLTSLTAPDGSVEVYAYSETNLVETVDVTPVGGATTRFVSDIDYDAKGQRRFISYGNGVRADYDYDAETDRVARIRLRRGASGPLLQELAYTYDPVGNVTAIDDAALSTLYFNNAAVAPGGTFSYDAVYRLAGASGREHASAREAPDWGDAGRVGLPHKADGNALQRYQQWFDYDASGNLHQIVHSAGRGALAHAWTRSFAHGGTDNRLLASSVGAAPAENYAYDLHGNTSAMPHLASLAWDEDNRLVHVVTSAGDHVWHNYDSEGNRVRKYVVRANGTTEDRVYVGRWERVEHGRADGSLRVARETLHVLDGQARIAMIERRTAGSDGGLAQLVCYQFGNALGTALLELDDAGAVISYEEFHPFGSSALQSVSTLRREVPKRYRYTGKERDAETGFYYHGARYMAPWLCRWTSPDPLGASDGNNLYVYAGNRPIGSNDSTGLWEMPSWRTVAIVAAVVVVGAVVTVATAGAAAPIVAGAVASIGLTGTAATVATGVGVGIASGAAAGFVSGAAGEATRQTVNSRALGLGTAEFSGRAILSEAGSGAVTGAAIGGAIGGAAAFAGTAAGAAAIGVAGRATAAATRAVVPAAIRSAVASGARGAAGAIARTAARAGSTAAGQTVRRGVEAVGRRVAALEQASAQRGLQVSRGLYRQGSIGRIASERVVRTGSIAETFNAQPTPNYNSQLAMMPGDEAAGVLSDGVYRVNPTARLLEERLSPTGLIENSRMSGRFMYVVNEDGQIIMGTRGGLVDGVRQRMPHPTLVGGAEPQVQAAGMVDIRGGRIFSVDNDSGHFRPSAESLQAAAAAFGRLPDNAFHRAFQGFLNLY
ncbi:SpvB/TcaC N-terminal domain-containing protein [Massilia pseudoviolaceinigra]|uniref:SpvB/TcaC N-terminal domain-containing protein n=1 Tax=Massilia pseudoviolaceinigra TaxID=3057165 RepID=UPI00279686C3|nr:SpvB/TcaC N-terminal domain-containing protein [Massilia sp. CCM 9206]MDQ1920684.1 SpvB/TcaC N-terminal domain-containing protein [Massilia sp. CCM 9206]